MPHADPKTSLRRVGCQLHRRARSHALGFRSALACKVSTQPNRFWMSPPMTSNTRSSWRSLVGGYLTTLYTKRQRCLRSREQMVTFAIGVFHQEVMSSRVCLRVSCLHDGALQASAAALLRLRIQPPAAVFHGACRRRPQLPTVVDRMDENSQHSNLK